MVDGRNGVEKVRRQREVTGDEVEGTNESLGLLGMVDGRLLLLLVALQLSHDHGGREATVRLYNEYLKERELINLCSLARYALE